MGNGSSNTVLSMSDKTLYIMKERAKELRKMIECIKAHGLTPPSYIRSEYAAVCVNISIRTGKANEETYRAILMDKASRLKPDSSLKFKVTIERDGEVKIEKDEDKK